MALLISHYFYIVSQILKKRIYRTIISPVVIYEGKVWKLNMKENLSLEIFERKVLRKCNGAKK